MKRLLRLVVYCVLAYFLALPSLSQGQFPPRKGAKAKAPAAKTPMAAGAAPAETGAAGAKPSAEQLAFFEKSIRPVLAKECYTCHAQDAKEIKGGLTLDTRDGIRRGGDTGPAIVPGDLRKSLVLQAIKHVDAERGMPPDKKLPAEVVAAFEKWVSMGAPDPRDGVAKATKVEIDIEKGRAFWAFQPPRKTAPPAVKDTAWPRGDIDRYLLAALEAKGLRPVADADPRALLRRVHFDLVGLPPSPEDVERFVQECAAGNRPAALEKVVAGLLSSPQFGERWGRHWLDVARYGESSGRAANFAYPHAWRYRDYVIAAFNGDKPYDQFIREQLAGDLLPAENDRQRAEYLVATGFLAIGPKSHDERSARQFQMDVADEQIDATFQAFQALTAACARCHDHKFDPVPQKDYYALAGIFRSTETCYGTIRVIQSNHPSPLVTLPKDAGAPAALEPLTAERRTTIEKQIKDVQDQSSKLTGQDAFIRRIFLFSRTATLQSQLASYESDGTPKPLAMGVRDRRFAADSPLYVRGELDQPGETVRRGFPQVMTKNQPSIRRGSGRLELAQWIASRDNPLTARVMANRAWIHLIGRGLVATPDNFGASGQTPSHGELLDHLALSLVDNNWSVKQLVRTIVLSRAYQLSSRTDEKNFEADPDNVLVWRMPQRRLEAEALRDTMLALSGQLDASPARGSSIARGGEGSATFRFRGPGDSSASDTHRTVYTAIVRDGLPESLTLFDFPDPSLILGERATTTVPAQSLYLMNNPFVIRQAEALADRLLTASLDDAQRLTKAYLLCFSREPSERERHAAHEFLNEYGRKQPRRTTWSALCQALLASAEFAHR